GVANDEMERTARWGHARSANVTETATPSSTVESPLGLGHDVEDLGQEERGVSSARGDCVVVRDASRSGVPERATFPERPKRRVFTTQYKLRIVREADG